jgi:hypothetical protein
MLGVSGWHEAAALLQLTLLRLTSLLTLNSVCAQLRALRNSHSEVHMGAVWVKGASSARQLHLLAV